MRARATLQGLGGALLIPGSLALISVSFPAEVRGRAIGLWSGFSVLTAAAGPVLGGWLIDTLSLRWIFFANIPVALVILAIAATRLPESRDRGLGKPETFAFLGFTHIYGRTRQGRGLIRRHTVRKRLNAKLRQVKATLRRIRHMPVPEQGRYLRLVLNGFYKYYAVPTNFRALNSFYWHILRYWQHCLRRRSRRRTTTRPSVSMPWS